MRNATNFLAAAALLAALSGCGSLEGAPPPQKDAMTVSVEKDGRFISVVGPKRQHAEPFLGVPATNYYALRSWLDTKTGEVAHQLYVEDSYFGAARDWNAARDAQGQPLKFVPVSKNEITCDNGCSYAEEFAASLPDALLRRSPQGLAVTFSAKSSQQMTITVPTDRIEKQLAAVDAARAGRPTASAAASAPPPSR